MIFFTVTQNINIKLTDKSLVKYEIPKKSNQDRYNTIYCSTFDDFKLMREVFKSVGEKYQAKIIQEKKIKSLKEFPKPLGIVSNNEYYFRTKQEQYVDFYLDQQFVDINTQLNIYKKDITIAVVGSLSNKIGQMICATTALRILYRYLQTKFKTIKIDIFIEASKNQYYSRDKEILKNYEFINKIQPLSVSVKKLFEYDFYIDMGSFNQTTYAKEFNFTDAYLYKFGIDYKKILDNQKYNEIKLSAYKPKQELQDELLEARLKGKLLLFHPYSSELQRSMPSDLAKKMLQKLILKAKDYLIVTILNIEKIKDDSYLNLSKYSKDYSDFAYIVSQMDSIITVDTSTYHIADAFAIPTVVIFTNEEPKKRIRYYIQTKAVKIDDKTKNMSNFIYKNDDLIFYKYDGWRDLKVKKLLKLL